jgi:CTP:molybdopterin cytidylyltransferase MocA
MIGAIVLAAGGSTRMGRPKATLHLGGSALRFADAIASTLKTAGVARAIAVVSPGARPLALPSVVNPDPSRGMLSSIACGLTALPPDLEAILLWPVDHPLVQARTVASLVEAFRRVGAPIVVPAFDGRRGHPVLFASRVVPELLAADPSAGARAVVHAYGDRLELAVEDRGILEDIDTPADYERVFGVTLPDRCDDDA